MCVERRPHGASLGESITPAWTLPEGISLENAKFLITYYDSIITDGADLPSAPQKSWTFKTIKNRNSYYINVNNAACFVSGDELFRDTDNRVSFPAGTVAMRETEAPLGFRKNESTFILTVEIDENGTRTHHLYEYDGMTTSELSVHTVAAGQAADLDLTVNDEQKYGSITVTKADIETVTPQGDGSFDGIEVTAKNVTGCTVILKDGTQVADNAVVRTLAFAGGSDEVTFDGLPAGSYEIAETKGNDSYKQNTSWSVTVSLSDNGADTLVSDKTAAETTAEDEIVRGGVKAGKRDAETVADVPQGWGTFEGAEFTVFNNSADPVRYDGKDFAPGEAIVTIITDKKGIAATDADVLPFGTYYIKETKAPSGYLANEDWQADFEIREDGVIVDTAAETEDGSSQKAPEDIIRADLQFYKYDIDGRPMAGIPFLIERLDKDNETVVEAHVVVTDETGYINTAELPKTGESVNSLDSYAEGGKFTDESVLDSACGVWFGEKSAMSAERGSLIYANYRITELQCEANKGMDLLSETLLADEQTDRIAEVFKEKHIFNLHGIFINLVIHPESEAKDEATASNVLTFGSSVKVSDTFRYDNLKTYNKYKLETEMVYVSRDGGEVRSLGKAEQIFCPQKTDSTSTSSGQIKNTVEISTEGLEGGMVNAVDRLYILNELGETLLTEHNTDMDIESQTLYVPYMETDAVSSDTGTRAGGYSKQTRIMDMVSYENLRDDGLYLFEAALRNAEDGEIITGADGNPCITTRSVRISHQAEDVSYFSDGIATGPKDGVVEMPEFIIDSTAMKGMSLVVTERVYDHDSYDADSRSGEIVLEHYDLDDERQTIRFPEVTTRAVDPETGTRTAVTGKTTITDEVTMTNLIEGISYKVTGDLVYTEDCVDSKGNSHKKGDTIATHEPVTVVADGPGKVIYLDYEVDASLLEGISGVVFEDVYVNDFRVAAHHDYDAIPQIPNWPKVYTSAVDKTTGNHTGLAAEEASVVDTVFLDNLTAGDTYRVVGTLMYNDGTPFLTEEGEQIVVSSEAFTAEENKMTIEMVFSFDGSSLSGKSLVVFEKLFCISADSEGNTIIEGEGGQPKETEVAHHEDKNDQLQTVDFPEGNTNASDGKTADHVGTIGEKETIVDKVTYRNLHVGEEYSVIGDLHYLEDFTDSEGNEHKAGDTVTGKDGKAITASTTFTAEQKSGSVFLTYELDSTLLKGQSVVVFEDFFSANGTKVYAHADLEDEEQSVHYPDGRTELCDSDSKRHETLASEDITLIDTVTFRNLIPGETYTMQGALMERVDTEEAGGGAAARELLDDDGKPVISEPVEFIPEKSDGIVEIKFRFSGVKSAGKHVVAYEECTHNGVAVFAHADIEDADQSVSIPEIRTIARDSNGGKYVTTAAAGVIVDTITYRDLTPGRKYKASGYLTQEGKAIEVNGKHITSEVEFTASETGDGTVEVRFEVPAGTVFGKVVVFEQVADAEPGTVIAIHADKDDENQTVYLPKISTTLTDTDKSHNVTASNDVELIDTVKYTDLEVGAIYRLKAVLADKKGNPVRDADGKEIKAELTFECKSTNGTVEVMFGKRNLTNLCGEYVCFETLYKVVKGRDGKEIEIPYAKHKNLNDADQTVTVTPPEPQNEGRKTPQTGDSLELALWGLALMVIIALMAAVLLKPKLK